VDTTDTAVDPARVAGLLAAPFPANEVRWKLRAVSGNRALVICYIDARAVSTGWTTCSASTAGKTPT
jgi:hypothetical protein